jgi:hypothetical protein
MSQDLLPFLVVAITTFIGLVGWSIQRALAKAKLVDVLDHNIAQLKADTLEIKTNLANLGSTLNNHILDETHDVAVVSTKLEQIMKHIEKEDDDK